ncbi:MAG: quinolinate synthase NadA [Caldisericia bacterium]|nr:quinolinate synthase NadA [Caldisericia bacterium]
MNNVLEEIEKWKLKKNALIVAHNYQPGYIQDIADIVGDSLELSKLAKETSAPEIVFCGVKFMAETAKVLSPEKNILIPKIDAECDLAKSISLKDLDCLKEKYPNAPVVCYVNSTLEMKANSNYCCTSSNALKVVESIPEDTVIFVPDKGLGSWIKQKSYKNIILHPGKCPVHWDLSIDEIEQTCKSYPGAPLLTHPESNSAVRDRSDFVGGTGGMINFVKNTDFTHYIIATDVGMIHRLKKLNPKKDFILAAENISCRDMKKISTQDVLSSLKEEQYLINIDPELSKKALMAINKMMEITA